MKTIIAGSREATLDDVLRAIWACPWWKEVTCVVSGAARGADRYGETISYSQGIPVELYPAQWDVYGKSAGYRRNETMAQNAQALIAVWDGNSPGTKHMIEQARQKGLRVFVHQYKANNSR